MNCPSCGLANRPFEADCAHCRLALQDEDAAAAKRREWDALSPRMREEQERHFAGLRARFDEHAHWLKRHRLLHGILGGLAVGFFMNAGIFFATFWTIPIDLAIGAAAGVLLNRLGGGAYRGLAIFGGAAAASLLFFPVFLNMEVFLKGFWLFTSFAVTAVAGCGYALGLKLDFDHVEHQIQ